MSVLQSIYLVCHGETAWSLTGQHAGLTDLPLTARGERNARRLGERLMGQAFARVFTSGCQRARRTCQLAGFASAACVDRELAEWNCGDYEGRRTEEIHFEDSGWQLFRDGCPGGESPNQVRARAGHILKRVRAIKGDVLIFSSGHFLSALATCWLGLELRAGEFLPLSASSLSVIGYKHNFSQPAIHLWNDTSHLEGETIEELKYCLPGCSGGDRPAAMAGLLFGRSGRRPCPG
ncbi:MAG TPA: histidine phosphatase family protein [Alphaproteobacteria bacterium]|nr:histidine phosphatase family protein [Alphaproteobacteria bacterium]